MRSLPFKDNYPKIENPGPDFLKDTSIISNLIFTIQQVTIMQVLLNKDANTLILKCGPAGIRKSAWSFRTIMKTGIPRLIQINLIIVSCIGVRE